MKIKKLTTLPVVATIVALICLGGGQARAATLLCGCFDQADLDKDFSVGHLCQMRPLNPSDTAALGGVILRPTDASISDVVSILEHSAANSQPRGTKQCIYKSNDVLPEADRRFIITDEAYKACFDLIVNHAENNLGLVCTPPNP